MKKTHFLLLEKVTKNTASAQLWLKNKTADAHYWRPMSPSGHSVYSAKEPIVEAPTVNSATPLSLPVVVVGLVEVVGEAVEEGDDDVVFCPPVATHAIESARIRVSENCTKAKKWAR